MWTSQLRDRYWRVAQEGKSNAFWVWTKELSLAEYGDARDATYFGHDIIQV